MSSPVDSPPTSSSPTDPVQSNQSAPEASSRKPGQSSMKKGRSNSFKDEMNSDASSKFKDPCAEASAQSLLCLDLNDYDRKKCTPYFQAYRECKERYAKELVRAKKAA